MSLLLGSISEYALTELPAARPESDLEIELFTDVSIVRNLPSDTGELALNYANDEVNAAYYGGNTTAWLAELSTVVVDDVQQVFNFDDSIELKLGSIESTSTVTSIAEVTALDIELDETFTTLYKFSQEIAALEAVINSFEQPSWLISDPVSLLIKGDYFHNLRLYSTETGTLSFEAVEKQFAEDTPSESWRGRPGLPIGPISFNTISIEQREGSVAKIYPNKETAELVVSTAADISSRLNYTDSGAIILNDSSTELQSYNFIEQGNLTTVSIKDIVVFLNSFENATLEIAAQDQIQQVFEFLEVAGIVLDTDINVSSTINDVSSVGIILEADSTTSIVLNYRDPSELFVNFETTESKLSTYIDTGSLTTNSIDLISIGYHSFESSGMTVFAKTFAKEYTFLQQEYADDFYELKLSAESSESFRSTTGIAIRNQQFWIG